MIRLWLLKTIILGLTKYSQKSNILIFCIFFVIYVRTKKSHFSCLPVKKSPLNLLLKLKYL